jgi:hypothetical protein
LGTGKVVLHEEGKAVKFFGGCLMPLFLQKLDLGLPQTAKGETMLLVYVLGVDLVLYCSMVHEPGFCSHDAGSFEQDVMGMIIIMFFYCQLLWLIQLIHFLLPVTLVPTKTLFSHVEDRGSTFTQHIYCEGLEAYALR